MKNQDIRCRICNGTRVIKKGLQRMKFGYAQMYYCKDCRRRFVDRKMINKTYGPRIINHAVSSHNLGSTLADCVRLVNKRFKVKLTKSTVHRWVDEFSDICTYRRMRDEILKNYGKDVLFTRTFEHKGLAYDFRYHVPKLEILCNKGFSGLEEYVKEFEDGCPKFFGDIENRCSQMKIEIDIRKHGQFNNACRLASFALNSCRNNRERHSVVENFMLINDSSTVACEVPVWLWEKNLNAGINGHVDVLQVRNGLIYVLDFKPGAAREKVEKVGSQLFFYASGLSFRTGISLNKFRCAWFDEKVYFEFEPSNARVRFRKP